MGDRVIKLYYHTATGNSLKIAKDIGARLGNHELCSISSLLKGNNRVVIEGDIIGFVFPVYFARPPVFLREFIENADFVDSPYIFTVANGGGLFGRALKKLERAFGRKGVTLNAGFIVGMPGIHPKIASMQKISAEEHYRREAERVDEIAKVVDDQSPHTIETNFGLLGYLFSYVAFRAQYKQSKAHMLDEPLWVDERCDGCGICETVCPVDNIRLVESRPTWQHGCINCAACYHHCPKESIQLGKEKPMKRYRHPEIELAEIINSMD